MARKAFILTVALLLGACAYRAVGTPSESMYAATNECAWQTRSDADAATQVAAAVPLGALGGAIAGAVSGTDQDRHKRFDDCMLAKGWQEK